MAQLPEETISELQKHLTDYVGEFGRERLEQGVVRAIQSSSYPVNPADIRNAIPAAEPRYSGYRPSPEDLHRRAMGEMSFGEGDVQALWKMHGKARIVKGGPLSEREQEVLLGSMIERKKRVTGQGAGD